MRKPSGLYWSPNKYGGCFPEKSESFEEFVIEIRKGWQPSKDKKKHPKGVNIIE